MRADLYSTGIPHPALEGDGVARGQARFPECSSLPSQRPYDIHRVTVDIPSVPNPVGYSKPYPQMAIEFEGHFPGKANRSSQTRVKEALGWRSRKVLWALLILASFSSATRRAPPSQQEPELPTWLHPHRLTRGRTPSRRCWVYKEHISAGGIIFGPLPSNRVLTTKGGACRYVATSRGVRLSALLYLIHPHGSWGERWCHYLSCTMKLSLSDSEKTPTAGK